MSDIIKTVLHKAKISVFLNYIQMFMNGPYISVYGFG